MKINIIMKMLNYYAQPHRLISIMSCQSYETYDIGSCSKLAQKNEISQKKNIVSVDTFYCNNKRISNLFQNQPIR